MRYVLPGVSLVVALLSSLGLIRVPGSRFGWLLDLAIDEYGHWLVAVPLGLAALAGWVSAPGWRLATWVLCAVAVVGLMRPSIAALRLRPDAFSWTRLYGLSRAPRATVQQEIYARPAGQTLSLDLYLPATVGGSRLHPVLLVLHAGGWDSGDNRQFIEWNHRWAARGWVVAAINYRLAPVHPWPAQRDDVTAALAWLKANGERLGVDAQRVVLLGRSAGGQIASACAHGLQDPAVRGLIALYAPHDMRFAWEIARENDPVNSKKLMRQFLGGPPDTPERGALYDSASGQWLARPGSPPTLLLHGLEDSVVWYRHSALFAAHLREIGLSVFHVQLPWATHGFDYNPNGPGGQIAGATIDDFLTRIGTEGE